MQRTVLVLALLWGGLITVPAVAQGFFTEAEIFRISPRADQTLVRALVDNQFLLQDHGINSRIRVAHFLAQIMLETGGLSRLDENMNYSVERLLQVFSRSVITSEKAREIGHQPRAIANWVYGHRLGNRGRETDDGWTYRGSGYIQLTGRENFLRRGAEIGLPLVDDPDLARDPVGGLRAASAYWTARGINSAADLNDRTRIRVLVNGPAAHGLPEAKIWFNRIWIEVYQSRPEFGEELAWIEGTDLVETGDTELAVADILFEKGLLAGGIEADAEPAAYDAALRAFQESRGLNPTGNLDDDTLYAITNPAEWRELEQFEFAAAPLVDPEGTVVHSLVGEVPGIEIELKSEFGSGATLDETLDADERAEFAEAGAIYSEYELAEGRYDGETFIPFTVVGQDERVVVLNTTGFPARAIVQIKFRKAAGLAQSNLCSGAMISPDTVLTAGHCVHSGTANGIWYVDFVVFPGRNTISKPFGSCKADKALALRGWVSTANNSEARNFDMAALKLDCDVGNRTGWLGVRSLRNGDMGLRTTIQGYAGDKMPPGRQWISTDEVRVIQQLKAFYQNDTFGGTSGAPVFVDGADPTIFCVHTNGLHDVPPWSENNACTRITPDRLTTIQGWIAQ